MVGLMASPRVRPQVETGSEGKAWRSEVTATGRHRRPTWAGREWPASKAGHERRISAFKLNNPVRYPRNEGPADFRWSGYLPDSAAVSCRQ